MKQPSKHKKKDRIVKGTPSAVLLSVLIHAALFLLAGMLVVFTVVKKEEKKFEPPQAVERPKMKLKKPKVKIKKTSRPKPTQRIVTKVNRASMPDIQLPEMSGIGEGLVGDLGGFDMMPDLEKISVFGSRQSIGNDFEGTFYDFKRRRDGSKAMPMGNTGCKEMIARFMKSGWKTSELSRFYRSPKKLYTTSFMVAGVPSEFGPWAFGESEIAGYDFMLHYKGQIVHPQGGRFRFWGMGDNYLVVRVGGEVVFDYWDQFKYAHDGESTKRSSYHMAYWPSYYGPWFDLEPGVSLDMEVIFGEYTGGLTAVMLCVEEEGVEYPKNFEQGPMLPIFKTAKLGLDQIDDIYEYLMEDNFSVTNGPIFSDYGVSEGAGTNATLAAPAEPDPIESPEPEPAAPRSKTRTWHLKSGKSIDAELVVKMGDKLVLKNTLGKTVKVPVSEFSDEDLDYVELENPPKLKLTLQKETDDVRFEPLPIVSIPPSVKKLTCGLKVEKTDMAPYTKELKVELFTFASENDGDNYILLDRQERRFTFPTENGNVYEFMGREVFLRTYLDGADYKRGERYCGQMILVTDERGEIIAQQVSNPWMLEHLEFLRTFPVGRHLSDEGKRVHPPRAKLNDRHWGASTG